MSVLRRYRLENQMTQRQLAEEMGLDVGVVSRLERNIGNRNLRRVLVWCLKKQIDPLDIFPLQASA